MRTAVVSGATSGIGLASSRSLARMGYHVVVCGRSTELARSAVDAITRSGGSAEPLVFDLGSQASVRSAAGELSGRGHVIDVMINNAGVGRVRGLTEDGFEKHFGINHMGHFLLGVLTFPLYRPGTRVVSVTSAVHFRADGIDFERVRRPGRSRFGLDEYAVSKLANILYVTELARRHPEWRAYAVHPGLVNTKILPKVFRVVRGRWMATPEEGAATIVACATDPNLAGETGGYYADHARRQPSSAALDTDLASELWERSLSWCGLDGL